GASVMFNVAAFGQPPLFYHWRANGTNLLDGNNVFGSSTRTLILNNVSGASIGTYSVTVSNLLGTATSTGALLTVVTPPIFNTIAITNGTTTLSPSAVAGRAYNEKYTPNLNSVHWTN